MEYTYVTVPPGEKITMGSDGMLNRRKNKGKDFPNPVYSAMVESVDQALGRNLTSKFVRQNLCMLAFLRNDASAIQQQLADVQGKAGDEDPLLSQQSDTEAYYGRLQTARELSRRAVDSAIRAGNREAAAGWLVNGGLREAEFGNAATARKEISKALQLSPGRDVVALAALGLARAGDSNRAQALLQDLEKDYHVAFAPGAPSPLIDGYSEG